MKRSVRAANSSESAGRPDFTFFCLLPVFLWLLLCMGTVSAADNGLTAFTIETDASGTQTWSLSLQALAVMTALTLLPAFLLMMTAFTRIVIVLGILRTALGTAQTPSNQILLGLALFLTLFVMQPVFNAVWNSALQPYMDGQLEGQEALRVASGPFRQFMLAQTRDAELGFFVELSGSKPVQDASQLPFSVLLPAFVASELKTAFQIGFLLFIPFLIIDLVVASVLMSMGMMMLSPLIISLPFKLMLFVLVDGWTLVMGTLASSFNIF